MYIDQLKQLSPLVTGICLLLPVLLFCAAGNFMLFHAVVEVAAIAIALALFITGRKHQEALRASEQLFRAMVENSPDYVARYDLELRRIYVNPALQRLFGVPAEQLLGTPLSSTSPLDDTEPFNACLRQVFDTATECEAELPFRNAEREMRWGHFRFVPEFAPDDTSATVLVVTRDITERKRMERLTEARLRMLKTAYKEGISLDVILRGMLDEIEAQTGSSIAFYHFLEEDQQTLSLQNWSSSTVATMCTAKGAGRHYPVAEAGVWVDCVRERRPVIHNDYASLPHRRGLPDAHAPVTRELVVPVFRGSRIVAIIGVGNKPEAYTGTDVQIASLLGDFSWEIVTRKQAETAQATREREFRTLAENSPDSILRYDTACRCIYANPCIEKTLGLQSGGMLGKTPMELFPAGEYLEYQQYIAEVLKSGANAGIEITVPDIGAGIRYHHVRFTAERDLAGAIVGVLVIGRDITELVCSSRELLEKESRLNSMAMELSLSEERERRRIAAQLHDGIGQDLALTRIKLGMLSMDDNEESGRELLLETRELVDRVISRARSFTHLISPPILQSSGLKAAARWLGRQMETDYGLNVRFDDTPGHLPIERDLAAELYFSVRELLINITKHAGTHQAEVAFEHTDDTVAIRVSDDGVGFDPAMNERSLASGEGGVGLFNIRRKIEHLGGAFSIKSAPGSGVRATIRIPLTSTANSIQGRQHHGHQHPAGR